jgi:hypothetical protein
MSTDISDLPGPDMEFINEEEDNGNNGFVDENVREPEYVREIKDNFDNFETKVVDNSEPTLSFKKKISLGNQTQTIFETIKKELTLTNLLLLCIIFFSATSLSTEYARKTLNIVPFISRTGYSHMAVIMIKSVVLLLAFILVNKYVIPYLS